MTSWQRVETLKAVLADLEACRESIEDVWIVSGEPDGVNALDARVAELERRIEELGG